MKTWLALTGFLAVFVLGCNNQEQKLQKELSEATTARAELKQTIAERDKYFDEVIHAVNEVYMNLENIRIKEGKLRQSSGGAEGLPETINATTQKGLLDNIAEIGSALKENKSKIATLETLIKASKGKMASLTRLVNNLNETLKEREQSIAQLEEQVKGLETSVEEKTKTIAEKDNVITDQQNRMNKVFLAIGTRKELKEKGILTEEGGFLWGLLGSTTQLSSGVDRSLFTPIDMTKDQTISVRGDIDEIIPHRNESFFATAQPVKNNSVLTVVRPDKFWQDRYLVIVVD